MTKDSDFKKLVRQRMAATGQSYTAARAAMYRPAADVDLPLTRRAFGLKTSYSVVFDDGQAPDGMGAGEYLFRQMVPRGGARNAFLENGAGFCLRPDESGAAQPAYATPECDSEGPVATAAQVETAVGLPPQTTRARLRGLFIKTAKDHQRDFTIDWVHLKLNDTANPTVRCLDPLNANFELARRLIAIAGS